MKTRIEDYTDMEIKRFEEIHQQLANYNAKLGTSSELPVPKYSDQEMAEYSRYREILLDARARSH